MIKLHRNYIFNKRNSIMICILIIVSVSFQYIIAFSFANQDVFLVTQIEFSNDYIHSSVVYTKMLMIFWSMYLFGFCFYTYEDNYRVLVSRKIKKQTYLISKIIVLVVVVLLTILFLFFLQFWVGIFFTTWYVVTFEALVAYFRIFLLSSIYGLLSFIFVRLLNSLYSIFIPISFYIFSELLASGNVNSNITGLIQLLLPVEWDNGGQYQLYFGYMHLVVLGILYFIIGYIIYCYKKE